MIELIVDTITNETNDQLNWLAAIVIAAAILGHFGLRIAFYNRVNALGWRRQTIKRVVKIAFVETWLTFLAMWLLCQDVLGAIALNRSGWNALPAGWLVYGVVCIVLGGVMGLLWLWWRPILGVEHVRVDRKIHVERADAQQKRSFARTSACRLAIRIPFNQILDLAIERIDLPVPRLPESLVGYRIAHFSDIHLTGDVQPDFVANVIEHANRFDPELTVLSGDIVDAEECIDWIQGLFVKARAHDGCHFILGNHDTRVSDAGLVRDAMISAGWNDVGGKCQSIICRETPSILLGNETPWFDRPSPSTIQSICDEEASSDPFRLCLSHSPDQFDWARQHKVDLMLCGHTHGGQGRLPLAGPILSPSWHGSRWASGDFYRAPTTLHVSRGLGGVHLLRINCRPELSLITLRQAG